jgi:hypothetical protein
LLITFLASGTPSSVHVGHCGPCRWLANADGTNKRVLLGCFESNPAGTWSPDGSRIVCLGGNENDIIVIELVMGNRISHVAEGSAAIWLDTTRLLVET